MTGEHETMIPGIEEISDHVCAVGLVQGIGGDNRMDLCLYSIILKVKSREKSLSSVSLGKKFIQRHRVSERSPSSALF